MSTDGKKIKFFCSFGGKILPRPSDGALRYVGGDTRIISVREGVTFSELMRKMVETHGGPVVLKYQLPDEDLDALITVSYPEDLENMMEEYKKLEHAESSTKLRLFLFDVPVVASASEVAEGTVSTQSPPALLSYSGFPVSVNFSECSTVVSPTRHAVAPVMAEPSPLPPLTVPPPAIQSVAAAPVVPPMAVQDSGYFFPQNLYPQEFESLNYVPNYDKIDHMSPPQLGIGGALTDTFGYVPIAPPVPVALVSGIGLVPPGTGGALGPYAVGMPIKLSDDPNIPNLQYPLFQPSNFDGYSGGGSGCTDVFASHVASSPWQNEMRLEECLLCNKHLPHAHSDILTQERGSRANNSILEAYPLFDSFPVEDGSRLHSPSKMVESEKATGILEHKTGDAAVDSLIVDSNAYSGTDQAQSYIDKSGRSYLLPPYADGSPHGLLSANKMVIEHQEGTLQSHEPHFDAGWVPANKFMLSSSPSGIGVMSAGSSGIQTFEPLSCAAGNKNQLDDHTRQKNGMTEMHHFSHSPSSLDDQRRVDGDINIRALKEMKPIYSQLTTDARESRPQNDQELYPSNSYPTAEEIDTLLGTPSSTSLDTMCIYTTQPLETSLPSLLGNLESYTPKIAAVVKSPIHHEQLLGPEINGQITVGNLNLQTSQLQPGIAFTHVSSHPISDLVSSHIRNPSKNVGVNCDSSTSNSLFCNQDPCSIIQDSQMFSPTQNVANKEAFNVEVLKNEKFSRNINNGDISSLLEEGFLHLQPNILDSDLRAEPTKDSQEDHIKRELQATAEGVAALVLQPRDTNESQSQSLNSKGTLNNDKDLQENIISDDNKIQDANKEWEKSDHLFQIPGDIGHLQIIKNSDLEELAELGSGTFGTVYHGKWRGTDVAIKRINDRCFGGKPSEKERLMSDFWNEACKLADLHHPNVVAFYGIVLDGPGGGIATVTEYMVNGSLRSALQRNEKALDWRKRLLLAMDVTFGMEYLHGKNIVHFDLKSDNMLVNLRDPQRPICKVGDLGLSKVKCKTLISGGVRGTLPWMAPELLNGSSSLVSEKVDVFSFGIVMWEILTGEEPYENLHYGAIIGGIVSNTLRPTVPESCNPEWRSLMEKCWSSEPSLRPNFTEIISKLRSMAGSLPRKG